MNSNITKVIWSPLAERQYLSIKDYLLEEFSQKELIKFNLLLQRFESTVKKFPVIYPETSFSKNLRRAVLNKVVSVFYRISENEIQIVAVYDNRQDFEGRLKSRR